MSGPKGRSIWLLLYAALKSRSSTSCLIDRARRRIRIHLRPRRQSCAHRIHPNVFCVPLIVVFVLNMMAGEALLPRETALLLAQAIRKAAFDQLHGSFDGNIGCWCQQEVQMIGHNDEFMKEIFLLLLIVREHVEHQARSLLAAKERRALPRDGCDEECSSIHDWDRRSGARSHAVMDLTSVANAFQCGNGIHAQERGRAAT